MNSRAATRLVPGVLMILVFAGTTTGCGNNDDKAAGPGPTKVVAGVPVGYERSRNGAVAAATSYAGAVGSIALAAPKSRTATLEAITAPEAFDEVRREMEPGFEVLAKAIGPGDAKDAVVRAAPVGYRITAYTRESARVELWAVAVVGRAGVLPPTANWGITTVDLRWVDNDWKLAGLLEQSEGPTPQQGATPTPPEDFAMSIRDFKGFNHVPAQ